jgi:hypothetical protein
MSAVKQVAVFAENKPGETARITKILAEAHVNIRWVTVATSEKFGVMKLLVDKCETALETLKQKGLTVSHLEVLAVEVKDKPGALHEVADSLARHGVNVDNVSGFVANKRAVLVLEVHDVPKARAVLEKQGLRLLTQEEMLNL